MTDDRRDTAIHEAGHAVAAWRLDLFDDDGLVSIMPGADDDWLGICHTDNPFVRQEFDLRYGPDLPREFLEWPLDKRAAFLEDGERRQAKYRLEAEDVVVVWLAGCAAARIATPGVQPAGCDQDHHSVLYVLELLTDVYPGDGEALLNGLWAWLELRAEQLLRLHWPAVEALADELLVRGEIAGTEARQIMAAAWASSCEKAPASG
jgi:hypothetical protein